MDNYWSKHPEFLLKFESSTIWVLPTSVYKIDGPIPSKKEISKIKQQCKFFWTYIAIVRTTEKSDILWMVDTMPTTLSYVDQLQETIANIQRCILLNDEHKTTSKDFLTKYSIEEWSWFIPKETHITVAPYIMWIISVLTRHPNQNWIILNDRIINSLRGIHKSAYEINGKLSIPLLEIEWKNILPENIAYQVEWIHDEIRKKFWLLQIRKFAQKKISNYKIHQHQPWTHTSQRNFWVTPKSGILLPIVYSNNRNQAIELWKKLSKAPWYVLSWYNHSWLKWEQHPWKWQIWYFPEIAIWNYALTHNNTRFIQNALRSDNWFALLGNVNEGNKHKSYIEIFKEQRVKLARFFCDWESFDVVPISDKGKFDLFINDKQMTWDELLKEIWEK